MNVSFNKIIYNIVKEEMKLEHEEIRLTLRKNKINYIIASKRKICMKNDIYQKNNQEYILNIDEINIPKELRINVEQFNKNVIKYIILYSYSSILFYL